MATAIVIQGPYIPVHTAACIRQFYLRNPEGILIVLATYAPYTATDEIEQLLISQGKLVVILVEPPPHDLENASFWYSNSGNGANQNLQRITSYAGLSYVHSQGIPFTLKIRSDTFLGRWDVVSYLREQVEKYPPLTPRGVDTPMKGRLVVGGAFTISEPGRYWTKYHVRDHFYFGHTSDVLAFFECNPLLSSWRNGAGIEITHPESALTVLWLKDLGLPLPVDTRELLGRYFIVEDYDDVHQVRLAPRGENGEHWKLDLQRYLSEGPKYLKEVYSKHAMPGFSTTREQWLGFLEEARMKVLRENRLSLSPQNR